MDFQATLGLIAIKLERSSKSVQFTFYAVKSIRELDSNTKLKSDFSFGTLS